MNRRTMLLASLACTGAGGPAAAQVAPETPLFPTGPLSKNVLAKRFAVFPRSVRVPRATFETEHGSKRLADLRGMPRIVTLWAEWCAPCIAEMRDFAEINARSGGPDFEVVAILTASKKKFDLSEAAMFLKGHQSELPLWVEPHGGAQLFNSVALAPTGSGMLPCTLLVDRRGAIRGRAFGAAPVRGVEVRDGRLSEASKARMLAGDLRTNWSTPAAAELVSALKAGVLG